MTIRLALDRFEGRDKTIAVLVADDGRVLHLPRALLPAGTRGGEALALAIELDPVTSGSSARIDVNAAPADELRALPGVGLVLAERLIAGRPYRDVDDLARVEGLGGSKLDRLRALVTVGPAAEGTKASSPTIRLRVERPADGPGGAVHLLAGASRPDRAGQGVAEGSGCEPVLDDEAGDRREVGRVVRHRRQAVG